MARKLPWMSSPSMKPEQTTSKKRRKLIHPASDSEGNTTSKPIRKPQRKSLQTSNRTPSTSPPPQPPPQHSMRRGLEADDGFIMVEDEFLATAQLYTRHLHHAEYKRLKDLAETRRAQISEADITRPVSTTTMRDELRRKKDVETRTKRIDTGLEPLLSGGGAQRSSTKASKMLSDDNSQSDMEIEREDDPWQGTQLQRFMTVSPRKDRGLMGLQGVVSHTRAAAGFTAPERNNGNGIGTLPTKNPTLKRRSTPEASASETDDDNDDDLDNPSKPRSSDIPPHHQPPQNPPQRAPTRLGHSILRPPNAPKPEQSRSKRPFLDLNPLLPSASTIPKTSAQRTKPPTPSPPSPPSLPPTINPDPDIEAKAPQSQLKRSALLEQRLQSHRQKIKKEREGASSVLEIPVFLV